jgi:hypothetical protein
MGGSRPSGAGLDLLDSSARDDFQNFLFKWYLFLQCLSELQLKKDKNSHFWGNKNLKI